MKRFPYLLDQHAIENITAVFRRNYQMDDQFTDAMATQELGNADDIADLCETRYGVSFPVFAKVNVNGSEALPLFCYLKGTLPSIFGKRIKWNFTKFLIGRDGNPIKRFAPFTAPEKIESAILMVLDN